MVWPVLRLVWESRGYKLEAVADDLTRKFGEGFSAANLTRLTKKLREEAPEHVVAFILALPVLQGSEETAEVVRLGLAAMDGAPVLDAAALAAELAAKLPKVDPESIAAAVAAKVAKSPGVDELAELARRTAAEVIAQQPKSPDPRVTVKWAAADLAKDMVREFGPWVGAGSAGAMLMGLSLMFLFVICNRGTNAVPVASPQAFTVNVTVGNGQGVAQVAVKGEGCQQQQEPHRTSLLGEAAGKLGDRKPAPKVPRMMPHQAMPGQAVQPCEVPAVTLYGACWIKVADQKAPCPPKTVQEGNSCYVPVQADPQVPVTITVEPTNPEQP
ncbi:MAG TPA: hypothetical protein VK420_20495 [Longimicrobium sp.]|nr:hypothetical protein [Longimicrobium sp.]